VEVEVEVEVEMEVEVEVEVEVIIWAAARVKPAASGARMRRSAHAA